MASARSALSEKSMASARSALKENSMASGIARAARFRKEIDCNLHHRAHEPTNDRVALAAR